MEFVDEKNIALKHTVCEPATTEDMEQDSKNRIECMAATGKCDICGCNNFQHTANGGHDCANCGHSSFNHCK